jgi:LPXTG-motif cell wall-anchored protein
MVAGVAGPAGADHVEPILIEETANQTCADFAVEFGGGQAWEEEKIDPPVSGDVVIPDVGTITVEVVDEKVVNWSSDFGIDAVFLKAGAAGSHLYVYAATADAPEAFGDTGLTTPGAGDANQISHISFCWDVGEVTTTSTTTSTTVQETTSTTVGESTTTTAGAVSPTTTPTGELPRTGSTTGPMLGIGAGLLAGGAALVGFARRFRHS